MKKFLTGIAALVAMIGALGGYSAHADESAATGASLTPWVNDAAYAEGGFYLDMKSCQVWSPDRGWHQHTPSAPLWVNYPYGTAESGGGFYWSASCQVWTADANWHVFNPEGIWPSQPTPTPTPSADHCEKSLKQDEIAWVEAGCRIVGDVLLTTTVDQNGNPVAWYSAYSGELDNGAIVTMLAGAWVKAPWGAYVSSRPLAELDAELRKSGCDSNGCSHTFTPVWPDDKDRWIKYVGD